MDTKKQYTVKDVILAYDVLRELKTLQTGVKAYLFNDQNSWEAEVSKLNNTPLPSSYIVDSLINTIQGKPLIRVKLCDGCFTECSAIIYVDPVKEHPEGLTPVDDTTEGRASLVGKNVYKLGNAYNIYKLKLNKMGNSLEIYDSNPKNIKPIELFMDYRFETTDPLVEGEVICKENLIP